MKDGTGPRQEFDATRLAKLGCGPELIEELRALCAHWPDRHSAEPTQSNGERLKHLRKVRAAAAALVEAQSDLSAHDKGWLTVSTYSAARKANLPFLDSSVALPMLVQACDLHIRVMEALPIRAPRPDGRAPQTFVAMVAHSVRSRGMKVSGSAGSGFREILDVCLCAADFVDANGDALDYSHYVKAALVKRQRYERQYGSSVTRAPDESQGGTSG